MGKILEKVANTFAIDNGVEINILFLSIDFNNFFIISLREITSGPMHSIVCSFVFPFIISKIIFVKSVTCIGQNFVLPL